MCFPGFASVEGLVQSFPVSGGSVSNSQSRTPRVKSLSVMELGQSVRHAPQ